MKIIRKVAWQCAFHIQFFMNAYKSYMFYDMASGILPPKS